MYPCLVNSGTKHSFIILIYQNQSKKKKKRENTHVSLVNSGTLWSTRDPQTRVPICLILESRQISTKLEVPKAW